ncbi:MULTISPECIES: thioesterase family protein [unclassified Luteococcus]|uniref:thioesterase family protein n=1 Tax=unclassified Luteococcus TaxID=2639923 RepID=UPI00313A8AEB
MKDTLTPGLTHTMHYQVPAERTVPNLLPEAPEFTVMPQVLATGYMVGIIEWACMQAVQSHLDDGEVSLGTHVDLSHDAPTTPGSTVTIQVTLTGVEGRALSFDVEARDEHATISTGTHQRGVVNKERFEGKLAGREAKQ